MALALFDLDNTLLAGDSEQSWGEFLAEVGAVGEEFHAEGDRLYGEYLAGRLDIHESLEHQLVPLIEHPTEKLLRWREEFMDSRIEPMVTDRAMDLVRRHRAAGDEPVIVTASIDFVARPIAERLSIRNLLAIELERVDGRHTGRVLGTPTYREGKVVRVREWLAGNGGDLAGAHFYGDSRNDLPLLEAVDNPVAVDPDPVLLAHAEAAGWRILRLHGG